MSIHLDITQILQRLPHRYPFLLVDRVLEINPGKNVVAIKNVTMNEPFFPGHYPHFPIMPGVLIVEAMAQAAAILALGEESPEGKEMYFAGIDGARFKRQVVPGDQLILKATLTRNLRTLWKFSASAEVDGQVAAEAEIMCAIKGGA
jgi:3-hydroxyacyl-[acyl-carrier-protein] dehydratase